jgi:hypothetical protein
MNETLALELILDKNPPRCKHLHLEEGVNNYTCKCKLRNEDVGFHIIQLWCLSDRHQECIFGQNMKITHDELNNITLDVADLLEKKCKIKGFKYWEYLNYLRSNLSLAIEFQGYGVPGTSHVDWDEVRKERK